MNITDLITTLRTRAQALEQKAIDLAEQGVAEIKTDVSGASDVIEAELDKVEGELSKIQHESGKS